MLRKNLSPNDASPDDMNCSEVIQNNSILQSNSRRNACKKKVQTKVSLKKNQKYFPLKSRMRTKRKKLYTNSSDENVELPPIIKIFRRIDRKSKNIYLVDDKIKDDERLVRPMEPKIDFNISSWLKSSSPEEDKGKSSPYNNCLSQIHFATFRKTSTATVKTESEEHGFGEVDVLNLPHDFDATHSSIKTNSRMSSENEVGVCNLPLDFDAKHSSIKSSNYSLCKTYASNLPRDLKSSHSSIKINKQTPSEEVDVSNLAHELNASHSSIKSSNQTPSMREVDVRNLPQNLEASHSSIEINKQTPNEEEVDVWNLAHELNASHRR